MTVSGISDAEHQSALMQNDTQIGTIDYALTEKHDATSIGVNARAEKIKALFRPSVDFSGRSEGNVL